MIVLVFLLLGDFHLRSSRDTRVKAGAGVLSFFFFFFKEIDYEKSFVLTSF